MSKIFDVAEAADEQGVAMYLMRSGWTNDTEGGAALLDNVKLVLLKTDYVEPAECTHEWDEGVIDPDATCTDEGTITYTCTLCGCFYP